MQKNWSDRFISGNENKLVDKSDTGLLFCGDCLDIMRTWENASVDLVLTDPPYNVGVNYGKLVDDNKEDFVAWIQPRFCQMRRISQTVLITGQARLPDYANIEKWKWLLAWHKPAAMGRSPVGFCNFEPIALWGRGSTAGVDIFQAPIIPDDELAGHPCPKPIMWAIQQLLIMPWTNLILDPFLGSGTTCVAAKKLGRRYIGIDISPEYVKISRERLAAIDAGVPVKEARQGQIPLFA